MKRTALGLFAATLVVGATQANALTIGDVQIVGYQADNPDGFDFVTWVELAPNEELFFTDNGWFASGGFRSNEGVLKWTNDTGSAISAGTVISYQDTADLGTMSSDSGSFALSSSGDQIFISETSGGAPIYGYHSNTAGWEANATGSNNSALPTALNTSGGNLAVPEVDNAVYSGPRTGLSIGDYKTAIGNLANWTTTNGTTGFSLNSTDFSIVPEPSSLALIGLGGLLVARRRRV